MDDQRHRPHFGFTRSGRAVHAVTADHLAAPPGARWPARFNAWLAVKITRTVGSMWCAYAFAALALYGLPQALRPGGEGLVSWIAQTFLQLVLLSIIIVGQDVQSRASDARAAKTFEDTEVVVDRLDVNTAGGITTVFNEVKILRDEVSGLAEGVRGVLLAHQAPTAAAGERLRRPRAAAKPKENS